jgi:hypothetical protein
MKKEEPWVTLWRKEGDDMPCPICGLKTIETHGHVTECLTCGWKRQNPAAIENDKESALFDGENEDGN